MVVPWCLSLFVLIGISALCSVGDDPHAVVFMAVTLLCFMPLSCSSFLLQELELLISGLSFIDLNDLRANTIYQGYDSQSPQIVWFWEVLEEMDQNRLATFLQVSGMDVYGRFLCLLSCLSLVQKVVCELFYVFVLWLVGCVSLTRCNAFVMNPFSFSS